METQGHNRKWKPNNAKKPKLNNAKKLKLINASGANTRDAGVVQHIQIYKRNTAY
jgi:hypothetical protein